MSRILGALQRFNTVALALFLAIALPFMVVSLYQWLNPGWAVEGPVRYGEPVLEIGDDYEGEEIVTSDGAVVKYRLEGDAPSNIELEGKNISLTNMRTGKSITVLPEGDERMVLRFEAVGAMGEGAMEPTGYMVLAGTEEDYRDGYLDLMIGNFTELRQETLGRRLRFVDAARMIGPDTMSMIVWPEPDAARFWMIDLATLEVTLDRAVKVPAPETRGEVLP